MNTDHFRKKLLQRLKELDVRLHAIEDELDEPHSSDFEEMAVQLEDDEVLESLGKTGLAEARQIRAALKRIKNNTYGICQECKEPISEERLEVLPHTSLCKSCAAAQSAI